MNLSVVISTHNSESLLAEAIASVKQIAFEIIVVDNQSTDKTVQRAKHLGARVFSHQNLPSILNRAKNVGFGKARGSWILSLDPDERVSPELRKEIKQATRDPSASLRASKRPIRLAQGEQATIYTAYQMRRKNIIFGTWIKHGLWYPDEQIRLFQKGKGRFAEKHNHEKLTVKGMVGTLNGHLVHYNYTSVTQYLDKINHLYSDNEADAFIASGRKVAWYDAIRMPLSDFLTNFFARDGYKDGLHGLALSILQAFYMFVVFAKIWERQKFKAYNNPHFLTQCRTEFVAKLQEFDYWYKKVQGMDPAPKTLARKFSEFFQKQ